MVWAKGTLIAGLTCLLGTAALAQPEAIVHLACEFENPSASYRHYSFSLNEREGRATIQRKGGGTITLPAEFSSDTVRIMNRRMLYSFVINRNNLKGAYIDGVNDVTFFGTCRVEDVSARQF